MGPTFPPHPGGMQPHPGAPPGHPMAPGMAHNPSQPGATPGTMPHQLVGHMGVSGPGPQMNPAALMGGMPPGGGNPNAHAMQHLNPQAAQMFQHQQQMNQMCKCRESARSPVQRRSAMLTAMDVQMQTIRQYSSRCNNNRDSRCCINSSRRDKP